MDKNIVLIGMPAVGKSTIGVILAKALGYEFIDSDLVIQNQEGRLLKDIIAEEGIDGFLEVENRVNAELSPTHAVIATGGSVVYGKEAMEHLRQIGRVVYLKLDYESLASRLKNVEQRGVVLRKNQTLYDLYKERCPLYETYADLIVEEQELEIEQMVNRILAALM